MMLKAMEVLVWIMQMIISVRESFTHKSLKDGKKEGSLQFYKPKFSYIFCDTDGTLLNSQSQITSTTAKALREASLRGVRVVIATGKTRPAAISALKRVDLAGKDGIVSEFSPGVFLLVLLLPFILYKFLLGGLILLWFPVMQESCGIRRWEVQEGLDWWHIFARHKLLVDLRSQCELLQWSASVPRQWSAHMFGEMKQ
ncbi:hypothetical protein U1Q18_007315, partial [Sarracenia purpurea var. burkii]